MGKGTKDKARLISNKSHSKSSKVIKQLSSDDNLKKGLLESKVDPDPIVNVPPGVPECDVVLKGSKRFWYLEPGLFLFGIVGMIVSALLLVRLYFYSSIYF